jgi:hypothetical protein
MLVRTTITAVAFLVPRNTPHLSKKTFNFLFSFAPSRPHYSPCPGRGINHARVWVRGSRFGSYDFGEEVFAC